MIGPIIGDHGSEDIQLGNNSRPRVRVAGSELPAGRRAITVVVAIACRVRAKSNKEHRIPEGYRYRTRGRRIRSPFR